MWGGKAGAAEVPGPTDVVVVNADSNICRAGWSGIVMIDGAAIAVAPTDDAVAAVQERIDVARTHGLAVALEDATQLIGPADLSYLDAQSFRPPVAVTKLEWLARSDPRVEVFTASVDPDELDEAGGLDVEGLLTCAVDDNGEVVAAAGALNWDGLVGHFDVLTAPSHRGRGLAKIVSADAVQRILDVGLIPQWRARPAASKGVAKALGFVPVGEQASFRLASFDR